MRMPVSPACAPKAAGKPPSARCSRSPSGNSAAARTIAPRFHAPTTGPDPASRPSLPTAGSNTAVKIPHAQQDNHRPRPRPGAPVRGGTNPDKNPDTNHGTAAVVGRQEGTGGAHPEDPAARHRGIARNLVERPAMDLLRSADNALPSRVAKDKQEAVAKDIQGDVQKYMAETVPLVQARAVKLAPTTIGSLLEERFSEDELKQVVAIIESPVYGKFQGMGADMQKALLEKLVTDMRPTVEPKVRALEQSIGKRLGLTSPPAAATTPRAPAKPASR